MDALHKLLASLIAVCICSATARNATMDNTLPSPKPYKSPPPPTDPPLPFSNIPVLVWPPFLRNKSPPHRVYESHVIDPIPIHIQHKNSPPSKPPTYPIPFNPNDYPLPRDCKTYPIPMYIPPKYSPPKPTAMNPTAIYIPPTSPFKPTKFALSQPLKYKSPPPHVVVEPQPFPQDPPPQYTSSFFTPPRHHHKFPPPSD